MPSFRVRYFHTKLTTKPHWYGDDIPRYLLLLLQLEVANHDLTRRALVQVLLQLQFPKQPADVDITWRLRFMGQLMHYWTNEISPDKRNSSGRCCNNSGKNLSPGAMANGRTALQGQCQDDWGTIFCLLLGGSNACADLQLQSQYDTLWSSHGIEAQSWRVS